MKKIFSLIVLFWSTSFLNAQNIDKIINAKEVERIEKTLASDAMRGRKTFTPDIDRAADFIAAEFKAAGLQTFNNNGSYRQEFAMVRTKFISASATFDGVGIDQKSIMVVTCQPQLKIDQGSGYEKASVKAGANLQTEARKFTQSSKNMLVLVDKSFTNSFGNLARLKSSMFKTNTNVIFVLSDIDPAAYSIEAVHEITEQKLANVVGQDSRASR